MASPAPSPAPPTAQTPGPTASQAPAGAQPNANSQSQSFNAPAHASTSLTDSGSSPRPRDARTIHMVLASMGVQAYQERVPLQLLDFAYRYTSSILSDAQHLQSEGYLDSSTKPSGGKKAAAGDKEELSLNAVRAATASRLGYQFSSNLPKETLLEVAAERNRVRLPDVGGLDDLGARGFGVRLPHERFVMSGADWSLLEEWDSEDAGDDDAAADSGKAIANGDTTGAADGDTAMADAGGDDEDEEEDEDKEGYEALFGGGEGGGDDKDMDDS